MTTRNFKIIFKVCTVLLLDGATVDSHTQLPAIHLLHVPQASQTPFDSICPYASNSTHHIFPKIPLCFFFFSWLLAARHTSSSKKLSSHPRLLNHSTAYQSSGLIFSTSLIILKSVYYSDFYHYLFISTLLILIIA